ncbi:MAG: prolyl oligopeptidase family serine peptidase [Pirellulales bacterium]
MPASVHRLLTKSAPNGSRSGTWQLRWAIRLMCLVTCWGWASWGVAQGSREDYQRAESLAARCQNLLTHTVRDPRFLGGGRQLTYVRRVSNGQHEWVVVDCDSGNQWTAFRTSQLVNALQSLGEAAPTGDLDVEIITAERSQVIFRWNDRHWSWHVGESRLTVSADPGLPRAEVATPRDLPEQSYWELQAPSNAQSPDGAWRAVLDGRNVVIEKVAGGERWPLTTDGTDQQPYRDQFFWSPDSSRLVVVQVTEVDTPEIHLIESSPAEQVQPKLHALEYAKPGDPVARERPRLWNVTDRAEIPIDDSLFANPFDLRYIHWWPDSSSFAFLYNQRGHQTLRVVKVDAQTGGAAALIDEQSPTFVDYAHKTFLRFLPQTNEVLWMSERSGWNHIYLIDATSGNVKYPVTQGEWVVRGVEHVDVERRQIWLWVGGIFPDHDPYYLHLVRVDLDSQQLTHLTRGHGTHRVVFSPDQQFYLDTWSRVDLPPVTELRRAADGTMIAELERGDWSDLLATGWQIPERWVSKGRDGATDIHGVVFRPSNFDPQRRYPIVEEIYAGPQGAFVPKAFRSWHGPQSLAELGFIVVQIDGMGTSQRSKKFHDVCWHNLADAGFPDRVAWLKSLAAKYPQFDLDRVGIYGGSAGGQNAVRGLLDYPEVYRVGVADCGCHDNRMDKLWWNELWMGWPVGPHYEASSNTVHAARLQGKLMLVVGELDRNVDPASTMQLVNALVKADKDFELLVVPGAGHGAAGTPYGRRRQRDFLVRHLLGVEPRWERASDDHD